MSAKILVGPRLKKVAKECPCCEEKKVFSGQVCEGCVGHKEGSCQHTFYMVCHGCEKECDSDRMYLCSCCQCDHCDECGQEGNDDCKDCEGHEGHCHEEDE